MNKQLIQKFLDKACYDEQCQIELDDVVDLEKFAELIVKECAEQIELMRKRVEEYGPPPGYDSDTFRLAYNDSIDTIKEHFGVEE